MLLKVSPTAAWLHVSVANKWPLLSLTCFPIGSLFSSNPPHSAARGTKVPLQQSTAWEAPLVPPFAFQVKSLLPGVAFNHHHYLLQLIQISSLLCPTENSKFYLRQPWISIPQVCTAFSCLCPGWASTWKVLPSHTWELSYNFQDPDQTSLECSRVPQTEPIALGFPNTIPFSCLLSSSGFVVCLHAHELLQGGGRVWFMSATLLPNPHAL